MNIERMIKDKPHVIYDLDGTLVRLDVDWKGLYVVLSDIANEWGHVGRFDHLLKAYDWIKRRPELKDLFVQKQAEFEAMRLGNNRKIPGGYSSAMWRLKRGRSCSILSLNTSGTVERIFPGRGFYPVVSIDRVDKIKPDPMGISNILKTTGRGREEVIFIGNSLIDEETANAASVVFIHVDELKEEWFDENRS